MSARRHKNRCGFGALLTLLLTASAAPLGFSQSAGIVSADKAFLQAVGQGDKAELEKLLDAEFTWTDAGGKVRSKGQVLQGVPQPLIPNAKDAETKAYAYKDLGDFQVSAGRAHVLRVWVKRSNGWKLMVYQEVMSRDTPPQFTPGAGKECQNPCQSIPFSPKNETERAVALAYSKLETAAHARNSTAFGPMVADEFIALSTNSDQLQTKRSRMEEFDQSKDGGLAPTPLVSARMFTFGDAALMVSEHQPDRGNPLHVTRVWVKRGGNWMETLSYQTAVPH